MTGVSPPDNRQRPQLRTGAPSDQTSLSNSILPQIVAEVRIGLSADDLDQSGQLLNDRAIRRIRGLLDGLPPKARVTIDLGPMRLADGLLLAILADVRCAHLTITAPDWRVAEEAGMGLYRLAEAS